VWLGTFEMIDIFMSVVFCAIAVKLVDDFLDLQLDVQVHSYNFSQKLGNSGVIYGMLSLACAASINASVALPLFFASYSIGMFHDLQQSFPSGFTGLQESMIVILIGTLISSWQNMLFSILFIFSVQLIDDYIDMYQDQLAGHRNLAHRLGKVECVLLSLLTLLAAWQLKGNLFLPVLLGTVTFYSALLYYQRGKS